MTTHEIEVTAPVNLCLADGRTLNPAARGWSRVPLLTANLTGRRVRTKRWDYWAIVSEDLAVAITYGDVGYLGNVAMWWADLNTGVTGGRTVSVPGGRGLSLPDHPGSEPLTFRSKSLDVDLVDETIDGTDGTTFTARWTESDGSLGTLDARVDLPEGHESLNVVIPWDDRKFQYTSKHQARPARGVVRVGDTERTFGTHGKAEPDGNEAWGVLDVGRGRWPYSTRWNWGGGAGRASDGTIIGLQFGAKWTEGTGFTENGVIVDGRLTKIGDELVWDYDWDHPLRPWRVRHPDGSLDVTLSPKHDRHTKVEAVVLGSEVHQVFGTWAGMVTADDGTIHRVEALPGFAEESRSRW
ncbi:MAG: DUF2804 domain-containing protein [Aquihabitans sp.]